MAKAVADHFNIPAKALDNAFVTAVPTTTRKAHARKLLSSQLGDGRETKTIQVPESENGKPGNNLSDFVTARVSSEKSFTRASGGTGFRTVGFRFPLSFDLLMISQALGSALKARTPSSFSIDGRAGKYTIYRNQLKQPFNNLEGEILTNGCWVLGENEAGVSQNTSETGLGSTSTTQPLPPKEVATP